MSRRVGLQEAADLLAAGKLVAIPTETVYGLAANANNEEAVAHIFAVKGRPRFNPIISHLPDVNAIFRLGEPSPTALRLAQFWPGPLTMLLKHKGRIPAIVTAGLPLAGFRIPAHPLALDLLRLCPFPLAAPSANVSGQRSPTNADMVLADLGGNIAGVLDGGACQVGIESTVIGFRDDKLSILRSGGISREMLLQAGFELSELPPQGSMPPQSTSFPQFISPSQSASPSQFTSLPQSISPSQSASPPQFTFPLAPGQSDRHYAPSIPMLLLDMPNAAGLLWREPQIGQKIKRWIGQWSKSYGERFCYLAYGRERPPSSCSAYCNLSPAEELAEAARNLFQAFDLLGRQDCDLIIAHTLPESGLGEAINDRLRRAAVKIITHL